MAKLINDAGVTIFEGTIEGAGGLQTVSVPVSGAEILACNTTPVVLVASPGAGLALVPVSATVQLAAQEFGYSIANLIGLWYTTAVSARALTDAFTGSTLPDGRLITAAIPAFGGFSDSFEPNVVADQPLLLYADISDPTSGGADAIISVAYYVVPTA